MRNLSVAIGLLSCVGLAQIARADDRSLAREHFLRGTKYFDLGRFEDAIKEYEAAYEIKDEPVLLYNLAQTHRLANHPREAIHFYKAYLRRVPKADNREEVGAKVLELEKLLAQQQKAQNIPPDQPMTPEGGAGSTANKTTPTPPIDQERPNDGQPEGQRSTEPASKAPAPAPPPPPKPFNYATLKYAGFALVGVAIVGLGLGIGMSAAAHSDAKAVENGSNNGATFDASLQSKQSNGKLYDTVSIVGYAVGGAAAVAAAVTLYFGITRTRHPQASLSPMIGNNSGGLAVAGTF